MLIFKKMLELRIDCMKDSMEDAGYWTYALHCYTVEYNKWGLAYYT